jgi:hypothetical protein
MVRDGVAVAHFAAEITEGAHGAGAVFGLCQQVGGQPLDVAVGVGNDQHFTRSGQTVDGHLAHNLTFRLGDVGVTGAGDDVAARHSCRTAGHSGNRLRPADRVEVADAKQSARRSNAGGNRSVGLGR